MSNNCLINDMLTDDDMRFIISKLDENGREIFGLVCKRWLYLQSTERRKLAARAGTVMLRRMVFRFTGLVELDLSQSPSRSFYPGVSDSDLAVVADGFKCLKVLTLDNCKGITDMAMVSIGNGISTLQSLDVTDCKKLTDKGLSAVAKGCQDLRILHLAGCRFITNGVLLALSKNCPNLEELGFQGCTNITDDGLTELVCGCRRIKYLDISKCSKIEDMGITAVSKTCSSFLKTFKLLDCHKVSDESILSIAKYCRNIETLVIGGCRDITDESIKSLASSESQNSLKTLRMDWCLKISDLSLSCILTQCINLEALDIGCCEEITDVAFQGLSSCETKLRLKFLKVNNCPKITVAGIGIVLEKCDSLKYLDVRSCPHITKLGLDEAGLQIPNFCKVNYVGTLSLEDNFMF